MDKTIYLVYSYSITDNFDGGSDYELNNSMAFETLDMANDYARKLAKERSDECEEIIEEDGRIDIYWYDEWNNTYGYSVEFIELKGSE